MSVDPDPSHRSIAPATAAELRAVLKLAPDAGDLEVLREVIACRRLTDGALEVGFSKFFAEAVASGYAEVTEREQWADLFYRDPDTTREFLTQNYWRTTA